MKRNYADQSAQVNFQRDSKKLLSPHLVHKPKFFLKLTQFHNNVIEQGGLSILISNENEIFTTPFENTEKKLVVKSFAILPKISVHYLKSPLFNGLLLCDGTHINSIAAGTLGIVGSTLPNRRLIPITYGWSISENELLIDSLFKMILKVISKEQISNIMTDGGTCIIAALNSNQLLELHIRCIFNLFNNSLFAKCRNSIWKLNKIINKDKYEDQIKSIENEIQSKYPNYDKNKIDNYITELRNVNPFIRKGFDHLLMATSPMEGFNSIIKEFCDFIRKK